METLERRRMSYDDYLALPEHVRAEWVDFAPVLVAEILSPSTRSEDTVRKSGDYLTGGIGQYWIVDPDNQCIDVFGTSGEGWDLVVRLDDATPTATVQLTREHSVEVDLAAVLSDGAP